jgi:hypothetical protein
MAPKKDDWLGRRVRQRQSPGGPIGTVIGSGKMRTWWRVEWPDGKVTLDQQRDLIIVDPDEEK